MFQPPWTTFLPDNISLVLPAEEAQSSQRVAVLDIDEDDGIRLTVAPQGFTKEELFSLREGAQPLDQGFEIEIDGVQQCLALFSSRMTMEDHEVVSLELTFELDPFADSAI